MVGTSLAEPSQNDTDIGAGVHESIFCFYTVITLLEVYRSAVALA